MNDSRRAELAARVARVTSRIVSAAETVGRNPTDIALVVVTKTWPVSDILLLHELGIRDFAENKHQEAESKVAEVIGLDLRWHFVGQIQSNKATRIARYADMVHSVDSVRVTERLNLGAHRHERSIDCLVQVSLDDETARPRRGGTNWTELEDVAGAIDGAERLRLAGIMGVSPTGGDASGAYHRLLEASRMVTAVTASATVVSAGMSADFEDAVRAGATHVRVGSAILGQRSALR